MSHPFDFTKIKLALVRLVLNVATVLVDGFAIVAALQVLVLAFERRQHVQHRFRSEHQQPCAFRQVEQVSHGEKVRKSQADSSCRNLNRSHSFCGGIAELCN